ncbi:MAG: copper chaperone PCu(A)C [Rhizobiaceae bacterium]
MYTTFFAGCILATFIAISGIFSSLGLAKAGEAQKIGDLTLMHPTLRATVPGAKVGAGYLVILNNGSSGDRLIGAEASFAGKTEIHEMKMVDQVMKMRQLEGGLPIAAGTTEKLAPGGNHIMFMKLQVPLKTGDKHTVTLEFERVGKVELSFDVKSIAETMKMKH